MKLSLLQRCWRHLVTYPLIVRRRLPDATLTAIEQTVLVSERAHGGEIRVAIEADLSLLDILQGVTPRQRARNVFVELEVWDTVARNGVLIYLCLADRAVEIVADRGLSSVVSDAEWRVVCEQLQQACGSGQYQQGMCSAVQAVGRLIAKHYPHADHNEQPNRPVLL